MEYFKITRDGQYDKKENLKMKARNLLHQKTAELIDSIDYFFTDFGRV